MDPMFRAVPDQPQGKTGKKGHAYLEVIEAGVEIVLKDKRGPEFVFGPHEGELVEHHPDYLQWMIFAKENVEGQWRFRFPSPIREWAHQYLRARMGGRENPTNRSGARDAWNLDPTPWRTPDNNNDHDEVMR